MGTPNHLNDWGESLDDMDALSWENHYASHEPPDSDDTHVGEYGEPEKLWGDAYDPTEW
jgi:hypothetical protein